MHAFVDFQIEVSLKSLSVACLHVFVKCMDFKHILFIILKKVKHLYAHVMWASRNTGTTGSVRSLKR